MRLTGFPPAVPTTGREAIRALVTGDPLTKRTGTTCSSSSSVPTRFCLEPAEHLARLATLELELELAIEAMVTRWELSPTGRPASPTHRGVTLTPDNHGSVRVIA